MTQTCSLGSKYTKMHLQPRLIVTTNEPLLTESDTTLHAPAQHVQAPSTNDLQQDD